MSREQLGLFDTPPDRRETRLALSIVGLMFAAFIILLPLSDVPLGDAPACVPAINGVIFAGELIIATMLYAQAAVFRSRALTVLASGFVFIALLLIPYVLTFPGAFSENGLFGGGTSTAAWLMILRRLAFPVTIIFYGVFRTIDKNVSLESQRSTRGVLLWVSAAILLAVASSIALIRGSAWLPPIFANRSDGIPFNLLVFNFSNIALLLIAMAMLLPRPKSVLDLWLIVAVTGWLVQSLLNLPLHARFTLGWYCLHVVVLISHLIVLVALIAESNRLHARLALSTAARDREREMRMMSLDGVAATICHEVGQPLAASTLNASAALYWLTRPEPNSEMAVNSLREAIGAGQSTFDVIKSVRGMYSSGATGSAPLSEFSLNDVVCECASLLDRELNAQKVDLQLALDESLPPILANRVQLRRVVVNLLTNAIESIDAAGRKGGRIAIRSAAPNRQNVLLEVQDSGIGIAPEEIGSIFDPFFTTKYSGTGIGLSLSRSIVEEHGGRLWAASEAVGGATFYLQLPRCDATKQ